jgi:glycolate oxidase FAD binding subunit
MGARTTEAAESLCPADEAQLIEVLRALLEAGRTLKIVGGGALAAFGRPVDATARLELAALSGVVCYEPGELVLTARTGTALDEIERLLETQAQCLAFEPPDLGPLLGGPAGRLTLGGVVSAGLSGPRRFKAGAVRDHLLGARAVSGRAEAFVCGGRVVKNVTGYDLPKLLVGSFGTLAVLSELTLKVVPMPAASATVGVRGLSAEAAVDLMGRALHTAAAVSGACHLPAEVLWPGVPGLGTMSVDRSLTLLRLEGSAVSVAARRDMLQSLTAGLDPVWLDTAQSRSLWRAVGAVAPFVGSTRSVWRLSVPPARGGGVLRRLLAGLPGARGFLDWAGGLVWLELPDDTDAQATTVRAVVAATGGHATLVRATPALRREVPVFQPPAPLERRLVEAIKRQFDPRGILNPGRMYADL